MLNFRCIRIYAFLWGKKNPWFSLDSQKRRSGSRKILMRAHFTLAARKLGVGVGSYVYGSEVNASSGT